MTLAPPRSTAVDYTLLGWNNLGMHCMDSDYSVFSILPPYNTINAQLVAHDGGTTWLVTNPVSFVVTYEAVTDPDGSYNSTSVDKGNFWTYSEAIFGVTLAPDQGLPVPGPGTYDMPGTNNVPQPLAFETVANWFAAYGIPITPYDDAGRPNSYPLMRIKAVSGVSTVAVADIVLPVSDEMDCKLCHLSGSGPAAQPAAGWVNQPDPGRDYRLNILRLHDEQQAANPLYAEALAARGFPAEGLYASVTEAGRPVLCASCHLSEALPATGYGAIPPLTQVIHGHHASVVDPRNGMTLNDSANRVSCYTCHPGSATRCLRGAMGKAVAADGSMSMQCQSCHGSMTDVGAPTRTGWLDEPNCQACHTGDALNNDGQIRYTSVYDSPGHMREPANTRFATNPDTPPGHSLYRFSSGHGGLQCSACHGSTHAIYPSAHPNDNLANISAQGHAGTMAECTSCHGNQNLSYNGGPHGMHPVGNDWALDHADSVEGNSVNECRVCHGLDDRGTVLSRVQGNRTITTKFGTRHYWKGQQISCYNCHNGVNQSDPTTHGTPTASGVVAATVAGSPVTFTLPASTTTLRIIDQPASGTVGVSGNQATYYPGVGFHGADTFTFAAWNGYNDSNLATGRVDVALVDSVGDGVPDWWRKEHFGGDGTTTNADSCATCDPDSDTLPNQDEFFALTNPRDGRNALRAIPPEVDGAGIRVGFTSQLGGRYALQGRDALTTGAWTTLADRVWGRIDSTPIIDPDGGPHRYYRALAVPRED